MTPTDIPVYMAHLGASARAASSAMARAALAARNAALLELARLLRSEREALQEVNRLKLTAPILETVARGCEQIAAMPDPIGEISELKRQPSGIQVGRMRVPL